MLGRRGVIVGTAAMLAGCATAPAAADAERAIAIARRQATRHGWPPGEAAPVVEDRDEFWAVSFQGFARTVTVVRKANGEVMNFQVYQ